MKKIKPKPKTLQLSQTTKTLSATFFEEQLPDEESALYNSIKSISPTDLIIIAIKHIGTGQKKDHYHVIMKKADRNGSFTVKSALNKIHIRFRPVEDAILLANHGIESTGDFSACLSYILHQSYSAKRQHKKPYRISDLISNISEDEIQRILDGYAPASSKLSTDDLLDAARDAGYKLSDFEKMLDEMNVKGLTQSMETKMRNAYFAGAEKVVREGRNINRLCIFIGYNSIEDNPDIIKYAVKEALAEKNTIYIQAGANETINITPFTDAIIYYYPNRFLSEYYFNKFITQKAELIRGSQMFDLIDKKAVWAGDYIIFIGPNEDSPFYDHCFTCTLKDDKLYCSQPPVNVNEFKNAGEVRKKYDYFKNRFNKALSQYSSHSNLNYFEDIND